MLGTPRFGLLLALLCAIGMPAWSQTITGSIRGTVADIEGQPLPAVTLIVRSPALIGQRETITNEQGTFRFLSLPVGTYAVEGRLYGFDNINVNKVDVSVGGTTNVRLTMRVSTAESIIVEGDTPLIDPQNSGFSVHYKKEILQNVPGQRTMWVLIQVAPGITTDYGDFLSGNSTIAFGSNRQSNAWHIDGMDASGPETGMPWVQVNPDVIDYCRHTTTKPIGIREMQRQHIMLTIS